MKNQKTVSKLIGHTPNVTDFSKYKTLEGINRETTESNIKALEASFKEFGTASTNVTVVKTKAFNGKWEFCVVDGQNTIKAATNLGIGVNVVTVQLTDDTVLNVTKFIARLNNSAKAWSTNNFMNAFAGNGIYEYQELSRIKKESKLTITDLLHIFMGEAGTKENKAFKTGALKFIDEADSKVLLECATLLKTVVPNKAYIRRALYKVMRMSGDYEKLTKAIVTSADGFTIFPENEADFYKVIVQIYEKAFNTKVK